MVDPSVFLVPLAHFKYQGDGSSMHLWVILYVLGTVGAGLFQLFFSNQTNNKKNNDQQPYCGHHYERRQVGKMMRK